MRLGRLVLKLRLAETRFENRIAGAAELALALKGTLTKEAAFVVQLAETASPNKLDNEVEQELSETFSIVVALDNATTDKDKTGLTAYDSLYEIRAQIFKAILGWQPSGPESYPIAYNGGRILGITRATLWYQFEFISKSRITQDDGVDVGREDLDNFNTIYAQWVMSPSANLPVGGVPVTAFAPDMTSIVDLTDDPRAGEFGRGFGIRFDTFTG